MKLSPWTCLLAFLLLSAVRAPAEKLIAATDRIVFIGDSITGQGGRGDQGWMALIGKALQAADPKNRQELIPLGGSGQTVGSWAHVEEKSRQETVVLDIKEFDVRAELDQKADIVIIMLGMNDVLSTHLTDSPEGIANWQKTYRPLLRHVRARTQPRILALASPTPCTEDPRSPKNRVMDRMVAALQELCAEENCRYLPTRESAWEVLHAGRKRHPHFHITTDQVHPNPAGHHAIAAGMLRGLQEEKAARPLLKKAVEIGLPNESAAPLSFSYRLQDASDLNEPTALTLEVFHGANPVSLQLPAGWSAQKITGGETSTSYQLTGRLHRLRQTIILQSGEAQQEISIPAPWLVGVARAGRDGWSGTQFDKEAGKLPTDALFSRRDSLPDDFFSLEIKPGVPLTWRRFLGDPNYGGNGAPGVIDFAQVSYFQGGDLGYALRWIQSEKKRRVKVKIHRPGFASMSHAQIWLNGTELFAGDPAKAKEQEIEAKLEKGWNLLCYKGNFLQWQWQIGLDLEALGDDQLDALRYATSPQ
ncbi:MAG: SGNH/GDSL hydrolase family protein [Verrucomicrobiales bacterium]